MPHRLMTKEYFRQKSTAVYIINLVDYLNKNKITQEHLDNENILNEIIRNGMGKSVKRRLPKNEINVFKETLIFFQINELKKTNLYRINRGILAVACVEYVLYPEKDHEEYRTIYRCNYRQATTVYKKLRELCEPATEDELDPLIAKSARSFFGNYTFANKKTSIETVRCYLKSLNINEEEKIYIKNTSIQFINGTQTISTEPSRIYFMNREYFQKKSKANALINLVNYLEKKEVKEEDLKNEKILIEIIHDGMRKFPNYPPPKLQLEEFKKAILNFTIDYLTVTNLYRINRGILTVVCVEYVLFPGQDYEEYKKIYGCECSKATAVYKKLCGIPIEQKVNEAVAKSARSFFRCQYRNLETIRLYLQNIDIDSEEIEYIKNASIQLIRGNKAIDADQPPTNRMDQLEDHPINVTTDDEDTLPPVPDMPLVQVDPPSVAVDQALIISNEDELSKNMIDSIEYHTINVHIHDEQPHPNMIQIIYPDMQSLNVDPPSMVSIPVDQGLIISNEDELSTNMMDPVEDHPINETTDDEEALRPMTDKPLVHVDPSSVVLIPVDQGLIISNEDELSKNMIDSIEYHTRNVPIDGEQPHSNMVQITYPEISSSNVDPPSAVSIPVDQELIISNEDKLSTNTMDPVEDHPINVTTNDEETLPPMPDMPLVHVEPPSVVPIPVDQGFLSCYSPNEVVLAKRFNSYFWPAQIIEVYSDKMYVTFFPLSEEMEKEEVSSEEDVKAFTEEEIDATRASLCTGLSRNAFDHAVLFAEAELN